MHTFRRCVARYDGNRYTKTFSCLDQFLCMAFAQLTYRESLRAALTHDLLRLTPATLAGEAGKKFSQKGVNRTQARWENRA